jgi:nicotinamide mononucleotide transporter
MGEIWEMFLKGLAGTTWYEWLAVGMGIASVFFSRVENILVYPTGLVNTTIYIWLSFQGQLLGEALVNLYYTIMSVYGWVLWGKRDAERHPVVQVEYSDRRMWIKQLLFFAFFYIVIFLALSYLKKGFVPGAIPGADAFASATAFTGMWLMARKKVESWWWWIATNITSIPLYFVKGYVVTSLYYLILLVMAVFGLIEWRRRARVIS